MTSTPTIRILITDDHPIVRDGLRSVLSTQRDFEVVGEAGDGYEALQQIQALGPDVLLLDLEMPGLDGVETLIQLDQSMSDAKVRVIIFTAFDTDDRIIDAVRAGASGYLLKGAPRDELFNGIRIVNNGGSLLQPVIASKLIERLNQPDDPVETAQPNTLVETLTPREEEVLCLMAQGLPNKEIAAQLVITERTVKFHVSSVIGKFGVSNRTEAVTLAARHGLVDLG